MYKQLLPSLLLAGFLCAFASTSFAQGPGRAAYLAAENFRKQNKCEDAITKYNEAINLEPTNYKYYFQMGKCQYMLKDFESAKQSFLNTVDYKKSFTPAYSLLAKIYKNDKNYNEAIYYYELAARNESNDARKVQYKLLLVNLLLKEGRDYDARRHISEAKSLDPTNPNILFYSGEMASQAERWEEARRSYEQALESDRLKNASPGEKAKYYYGLGLALSNMGDAAGAKRAWIKANFGPYKSLIAEHMRKSNHVYYYKIAVSYYLNGEYDLAEDYISQALELQREFPSAFLLRGKIERKRGNISRAIGYYQDAIRNESNTPRQAKMYTMLANLQLENGDAYAALGSIDRAIQNQPQTNARLLYLKAKAEYSSGRYQDAILSLEQLLAAGVDTKSKARYSFMLGMAAKKSSDYDKAREAFRNAMYGAFKPAASIEMEKLADKG